MLIISQYPEMVQIPCYKRFSCNQLSQNLCFCIKNWNFFGHLIPVGGGGGGGGGGGLGGGWNRASLILAAFFLGS
jgi:hypothetical protein